MIHLILATTFFLMGQPAPPTGPDFDGDTIPDSADNCILFYNPGQLDGDGDSIGRYCDGDFNGDGLTDSSDHAILLASFGQYEVRFDFYVDGIINELDVRYFAENLFGHAPGPAAPPRPPPSPYGGGDDPDIDLDGLSNVADNCPYLPSPGNVDTDNDRLGDPCDRCLNVHFRPTYIAIDADGDGIGNVCDADYDNDGEVTVADFGVFLGCMGEPLDPAAPECFETDMDGDGTVTAADFGLVFPLLFRPTALSGYACADPTAQHAVCPPGRFINTYDGR